jgi:hypothetical protein
MTARHYDTVTKPALNAIGRCAATAWAGDVPRVSLKPGKAAELKSLCDTAASAGATPRDMEEAIGGVTAWNAFVRTLKVEGLA